MKVLVCEPYFTGSHKSWAEGYARHSAHDVRLVTHDGSFWKWRMQGGAFTLAAEINALVETWGKPDVLLVSDMVHLPALLGFTRRALDGVPVALYMHENQLTYPVPEGAEADETYAMTNWLSMAAADRVVFNSAYHRDAVFEAAPKLLRRFPDYRHGDAVERVRANAAVLPVGIDVERFHPADRAPGQPPVVLWNHRWEYDKDPETFFAALIALAERDVSFEVIVAGQAYQTVPAVFERARELLGQAREDYRVQNFLGCLDRCEALATQFADLPEGTEATQLAAEIKSNPEWARQAAEQLGDRLSVLYLALADTWLKRGQPQQAVFYLERVVQSFPNTRHAEAAQIRLSQIQGPTSKTVDFKK